MTDATHPDRPQRLLTLSSGGWVLIVTAALLVILLVWALWAPAVRAVDRPPGDGDDPATYGFDLSNFRLDRDNLVPVTLHREMVPTMDEPPIITVADLAAEREERGKFLVAGDRVVGVAIRGEVRAYPISILNVHEVIHDTLGGIPIAVTYCWLGDTVSVFDRRIDGETVELGHSGLVYNCNTLLFDRRDGTGETLFLQMTGESVAGPRLGQRLQRLPGQVLRWGDWVGAFPETTIVDKDSAFGKRYKKAAPTQYFVSDRIPYPVSPMPSEGTAEPKARVVAVEVGNDRAVFTHKSLRLAAAEHNGVWATLVGGETVRFRPDLADLSDTVLVEVTPEAQVTQAFWFAWHALNPADGLRDP